MNKGQFKSGPDSRRNLKGRNKTGRNQAIALLDELLAKPENLDKIKEALQENFDLDIMNFFKTFVLPFMNKVEETTVELEVGFATMTPDEACTQMDSATAPE